MQSHLDNGIALFFVRFAALLAGIFGLVGLVLATVGIYGVIAYSVSQRTHEIGVRIALGAQRGDVLRMVIGHGLVLAITGATIGLAIALAVTRLMKSLLYEVSTTDPMTFTLVTVALLLVSFVAGWVPAHRATRIDPMAALRYE